ncbi:VOC family protein [Myceligenerans pegani]|uniref:Glyoxalase n=1 Tax=Myceligenerans pegani TaxID=2776917 RepID=A0ABR9N1S2_9MICO|nr:VOC family protein [Myceligenerans sp. TRM 65318]MBE1877604.1 glyoxalase [Myceligenerans sp. TRM 65318]MBE3019875.1 glyoxalase [Myceligenerans sp. TRM 65318]
MTTAETPAGFSTLNPFFVTRDAEGLITFLRDVFGGTEHDDARTVDVDGLLLHAELEIGGTTLMFGERKPGWPDLPQLTQIYVSGLDDVLSRAEARGARVVTRPTDFFGTVFSRLIDPWGNLWWVYEHGEAPELDWNDDATDNATTEPGTDDAATEWTDPGLAYIHRTLVETMPTLGSETSSRANSTSG